MRSVSEFEKGPIPLSHAIQVAGHNSAQSYIIMFGSHMNETEPPAITAFSVNVPASALIPKINTIVMSFLFLILF